MVRRYRPSASQLVPWLISSAMFVLIGLGALTQSLHRIGVGGVIVAVLVVVVGCVRAALRLSANVTLTAAELSYRYNFRRRAIPWPSVESFRVIPAPGWGRWSCVVAEAGGRGDVRIPIVGSRRYVQGISRVWAGGPRKVVRELLFGKYRWRTAVRRRLLWKLMWMAPKGKRDCGWHEWYRESGNIFRCYHCVEGYREAPSP